MAKNFNTRTASLKATIADIRNLDAKQINLDGKNILEYLSDSEFDSYDTRDPQLKNDELDIWNTEISLSDNGHIEVKPKEHSIETISATQSNTIKSVVKVIDNAVLGTDDSHLMYWQTDGLTNGTFMFYETSIEQFNSDLNSLTYGEGMFMETPLASFNGDLSSLIDGSQMFGRTSITSFNRDLSSLETGALMFMGSSIRSFSGDLSSLTNGYNMFMETPLTSFNSNLSSLTDGTDMFTGAKLDAPSVANIVHTLPTHETNGIIRIGIGCDNTEADKLLFAQECDCDTWQELLDDFSAKNWLVTFQCNGRPAV